MLFPVQGLGGCIESRFPKTMDPFLVVPMIRTSIFWVLYWLGITIKKKRYMKPIQKS